MILMDNRMKKTYISPLMEVETLGTEQMLAASKLDASSNSTTVTLSDDEYEGEFSVKDGSSYWEW